ncbi:MAG: hypothetical protein ACRESC_04075, partial [Gammaproteobacteria bacterium]
GTLVTLGTNGNCQKIGLPKVQGSGIPPSSTQVATSDFTPMAEKEFVLGFDKQLDANWTYGVRAIHRWLVDAQDDECWFAAGYNPAFDNWAASGGDGQLKNGAGALPVYDSNGNIVSEGAFWKTLAPTTCLIANPGQDIKTYADTNGDGKLDPVTIPNSVMGMPAAKRTYNALEFTLTRAFADNWLFGASYTWSHDFGNEEGYVYSNIGQADPGLTELFDFPKLEEGAYGDLPNDHRHVIKAWSSYQFTPEWRVGGQFLLQSGSPTNCLDVYPDENFIAYYYYGASYWCGTTPQPGSLSGTLIPAGRWGRTPWVYNLDFQLAWTSTNIDGLSVIFNWYNVLGTQHATSYDEQLVDSFGNDNSAAFGTANAFQTPSYLELKVRYQFN